MNTCSLCRRPRKNGSGVYAGEKLGTVHPGCYRWLHRNKSISDRHAEALEHGPAPVPVEAGREMT